MGGKSKINWRAVVGIGAAIGLGVLIASANEDEENDIANDIANDLESRGLLKDGYSRLDAEYVIRDYIEKDN